MNIFNSSPATRRRTRLWAGAAVLAVLAVHSAVWFIVTGRIIAEIPAIRTNAAANGWALDGGPPERTGWPFAAAIRIPHPTASSPALRWAADWIDIAITPMDPAAVHLSPSGPQTIAIGSAVMPLKTVGLALRAPLSGEPPWSVRATQIDLTALHAQDLVARLTPLGIDVTALTLPFGGLLPAPFDGSFTLRGTATVNHPIPPGPDAAAAEAWRASGGEATLANFDLRWGTLHATGGGTLRLDTDLQPLAQAQFRIEGAGALLDTLEQARWLEPSAARAARAVIALQALGNVNGAVTLPIRLQGGTLTVMQFPVLRLPPIDWKRP